LDLILFNFRKQLKATPHVKFQRSFLNPQCAGGFLQRVIFAG